MKFIEWLMLKFCAHQWETTRVVPFKITKNSESYKSGERHILRCKNCGEVSFRDIV